MQMSVVLRARANMCRDLARLMSLESEAQRLRAMSQCYLACAERAEVDQLRHRKSDCYFGFKATARALHSKS
jgi:hypothetical protein